MRRVPILMRYLWAAPCTAIGALLGMAAVACGASVRTIAGVVEVGGGGVGALVGMLPRRMRFCAITLGHVVIGVDAASLDASRPHERVHVRQYERWGALFLPLYAASSVVALVRGRDPYRDNAFEREAFATAATPYVSDRGVRSSGA